MEYPTGATEAATRALTKIMEKKNMSNDLTKKKKRPFIIHYCGTKQECTCEKCKKEEKDSGGLFPTHTHGLNEIGQPEIFVDPLAFAKHNASLINDVYDYLNEPGKEELIPNILAGETLKVKLSELDKASFLTANLYEGHKDLTICVRVVFPNFEAVKLAYGEDIPTRLPFFQLYVLGDDFALDNDYYKGGVTW